MDYKETLNLPRTDFPMKANLAVRELDFLKLWNEMGLYEKMRAYCEARMAGSPPDAEWGPNSESSPDCWQRRNYGQPLTGTG